ncbi:MAG TPA: DUF4412 domain-containing protein [Lacunisphaera sp.]|nr:DUF4412 domain-containing protein [Lacunisphaera sp.]
MNPLLRLFAVGALLTTSVSFAADAFQGKVSLAITAAKGKTQTLNYSIKDQKLRMDIDAEGHSMASIMDMQKLEMLMLMPEQNMYMVMPIKKPVEKAMEKAQTSEHTADIQVTGKTETILGYKCNQVIIKDKDTTTEAWLAEGLGMFMGLGQGGPGGGGGPMGGMFGGGRKQSPAAAKWEEALKGKGGFPLRVISQDAKSKETFRMEATKIEPGSLPDSLFEPPPGYQKFQMPNIGNMFKGMGN